MSGRFSRDTLGSSAAPPIASSHESGCGLNAALARRELALFPRGANSQPHVEQATQPSSQPWHGYADEHLAKALLVLNINPDVFWNEVRSRSRHAVAIRNKVWTWMRDTPLAGGALLSLTDIGEATGGYDHTSVLHGIRKERKDATNNGTADKRNV